MSDFLPPGPASAPAAAPALSPALATYGYLPPRRYNTLAIVGFVLAFIVPVAGVVCSHIALSQVKQTNEEGHGLALAGVIVGYTFSAVAVAVILLSAALMVALISTSVGILGTLPNVLIEQSG